MLTDILYLYYFILINWKISGPFHVHKTSRLTHFPTNIRKGDFSTLEEKECLHFPLACILSRNLFYTNLQIYFVFQNSTSTLFINPLFLHSATFQTVLPPSSLVCAFPVVLSIFQGKKKAKELQNSQSVFCPLANVL